MSSARSRVAPPRRGAAPGRRAVAPALVFVAALGACGAEGDAADVPARDEPVALPEDCSALPPSAAAVQADSVAALRAALADAGTGDVVALADGTYDVSDGGVAVPAGVTLRSASGDAAAVVLDGGYAAAEIVQLETGSTLAELTVARAYADAITLRGHSNGRVYGVRVEEPDGRGVAVLPERGVYADSATVACVTVSRADTCDVGIEGVQTEGSRVYGARVDQPACDAPAIRFATGSRATVIERSRVITGGYVGLALGDEAYVEDDPRVYSDAACPDEALGHYGGDLRNVFAVGGGVRLESVCGTRVAHVSVWGGDFTASFVRDVTAINLLASVGAADGVTLTNHLTPTAADFVDAEGGDLHLAEGSPAIGAAQGSSVTDDIDGDARDAAPDVGADERR